MPITFLMVHRKILPYNVFYGFAPAQMLSRIVSTIDTIWTVSLSTIFCSSTTFIWYTHNTVQISTWQEHKLNWLKLLYIWMNSKLNNFGDLFLYYKSLPVFQHGNGVPRFLIQSCYLLYPTGTSQFHHYRSQELDRNLPEILQCFPRHPKVKQKDKIYSSLCRFDIDM